MEYTQNQIQKRYNKLFSDIEEMVSSPETSKTIFEIGTKARLHVDQNGDLLDETTLLMLGLTKPDEYVRNLRRRLSISNLLAEQIAKEINEKVLFKIRESIRLMSEIKDDEDEVEGVGGGLVLENTNKDFGLSRRKILEGIEDPTKAEEDTPSVEKKIEPTLTPTSTQISTPTINEQDNLEEKQDLEKPLTTPSPDYNQIDPKAEAQKISEIIKPTVINHKLPVNENGVKESPKKISQTGGIINQEQPKQPLPTPHTREVDDSRVKQEGSFVQNKLEKADSIPMKETEEGVVVEEKKPTVDPYRESIG